MLDIPTDLKNLSGQECWGQKRLYIWGYEDVLWP